MTQLRLNGLALMYIHSDILKTQQLNIIDDTIKLFCMEPRRIQFLFDHDD